METELDGLGDDEELELGLVLGEDEGDGEELAELLGELLAEGELLGELEILVEGEVERELDGEELGEFIIKPIKYFGIGRLFFSNHQQRCMGFQSKRNCSLKRGDRIVCSPLVSFSIKLAICFLICMGVNLLSD